ncbi:hypothetical protein [Amycolatopsis albispora]|nr:hypothetical protein [Amycolatopsis albispora]
MSAWGISQKDIKMPSGEGTTTDPGPPVFDGDGGLPTTPACPVPRQRGRRGRAAVDGLPSTAAFSNADLSASMRALNLLVLLVVTGSIGTMREVSRKLLAAHADDPWHWTYGYSEQDVSKRLADRLGRSARRTPTWPEIEELYAAHLPEAQRGPLLALTAGMFIHAHGKLPKEYTGPVTQPHWATEPVVDADTIRTTIAEVIASTEPLVQAEDAVTSGPREAPSVPSPARSPEESKLWDALAIANRGFLKLQRRFNDLQSELRVAQARAEHSEAARDLHRQMTAGLEGNDLWAMAEQALAQLHPELTRAEVKNLMYERLRRPAGNQLA